jgi:hypothetical protein
MWTTLEGRRIFLRPRDLARMLPRLKRNFRLWRLVGRNFSGSLGKTLSRILGQLAGRARLLGTGVTLRGVPYVLFEAELDGVLYRLWTERGGALRLVRALVGKDEYESEFEWDEGMSPNEVRALLTLYVGEQLRARGFRRWSDKQIGAMDPPKRGSSDLRPDVQVRRGRQTAFVEVDSSEKNADKHRMDHKGKNVPGAYTFFQLKPGKNASFTVDFKTQGNLPATVRAVMEGLKGKTWTARSISQATWRRPRLKTRSGRQREFEYELVA